MAESFSGSVTFVNFFLLLLLFFARKRSTVLNLKYIQYFAIQQGDASRKWHKLRDSINLLCKFHETAIKEHLHRVDNSKENVQRQKCGVSPWAWSSNIPTTERPALKRNFDWREKESTLQMCLTVYNSVEYVMPINKST